ncbi:MAG: NAD(P)H-binding protein [Cyanobacteria bacterium J06635_13]
MVSKTDKILVAGATGGVGQLVVAKLLAKDLTVRALTRTRSKAATMFDNRVEIVEGDIRKPNTLIDATRDISKVPAQGGESGCSRTADNIANVSRSVD